MTTEDDFQRALDANPDDWQTRLVFADWLQEQGDPRAEGYRALSYTGSCPLWNSHTNWVWTNSENDGLRHALGIDWHRATCAIYGTTAAHFATRREAEDAAALAFARLPAARRAELLASGIVSPTA
jgi:uncharacterized protein (TIGR02996 family)